ncbi:hypothetical protein BBJ28_00001403 [Nothophytophthora sp. Chile5]|nr:hypothetical protein BBJ28_00001403 [Nothophytophthora sp. Chile5]
MADQVDPNTGVEGAASSSSQWSEHSAPNGRKYYYNGVTGESTWERYALLKQLLAFAASKGNIKISYSSVARAHKVRLDTEQEALYGLPLTRIYVVCPNELAGAAAYGGYPQPYGQPMSYPPPYSGGGYMYPFPQPYGTRRVPVMTEEGYIVTDVAGPGPPIQTTESGQGETKRRRS